MFALLDICFIVSMKTIVVADKEKKKNEYKNCLCPCPLSSCEHITYSTTTKEEEEELKKKKKRKVSIVGLFSVPATQSF